MRFLSVALLLVIIFCLSARFWKLDYAPPGFYADESAGAAQALCIADFGRDLDGRAMPLFFKGLSGGYTPTYIYAQAVWSEIFGSSVFAFRSLSAFINLLTILFLALIAFQIGGRPYALFAVLAAAVSPWSFTFARIAWDPPLMPMFLLGAVYFLFRREWWALILASLFFSLGAYSYAAGRLIAPLVLSICFFLQIPRTFKKREIFVCLAITILCCIPLLQAIQNGETLERYYLSVFAKHPVWPLNLLNLLKMLNEIIVNFAAHFSPRFLFLTGDANFRHSAQVGQLSWLDSYALILAIIYLIKQKRKVLLEAVAVKRWVIFLVVMIFVGILPAAVTWNAIPHALRAIGAWPFYSLLSGFILWKVAGESKLIHQGILIIAISYSIFFSLRYFGSYVQESAAWYDVNVLRSAEQAKSLNDWPKFLQDNSKYFWQSKAYYLMSMGGQSCENAVRMAQ